MFVIHFLGSQSPYTVIVSRTSVRHIGHCHFLCFSFSRQLLQKSLCPQGTRTCPIATGSSKHILHSNFSFFSCVGRSASIADFCCDPVMDKFTREKVFELYSKYGMCTQKILFLAHRGLCSILRLK